MMCDDGREAICQGSFAMGHATGSTMAECERYMRQEREHAGGAGQWLTAVKADHAEQLKAVLPHPTAAELQHEQMIKLNPEYEKLLQDVSEPEPSAISSSDLGDMIQMERNPNHEQVNHPAHYGGDTTHEVIKCLEAWGLDEDAYLFNVVKYIARPGKGDYLTDLKKARFYLDRRIARMEGGS